MAGSVNNNQLDINGSDLTLADGLDNYGALTVETNSSGQLAHLYINGALTNFAPNGRIDVFRGSLLQAGSIENDAKLYFLSVGSQDTASQIITSAFDNSGMLYMEAWDAVTVNGGSMTNSGGVFVAGNNSLSVVYNATPGFQLINGVSLPRTPTWVPGTYTQTAGGTVLIGTLTGNVALNGGSFFDATTGRLGNLTFGGAANFQFQGDYSGEIDGFGLGDVIIVGNAPYSAGESLVFQSNSGAASVYAVQDANHRTLETITLGAGTSTAGVLFSDDGVGYTVLSFSSPAALGHNFSGGLKAGGLVQDSSGQVTDWTISGVAYLQSQTQSVAGFAPDSGWSVAGSGDFNGDGVTDVLLRNDQSGISAYGVWILRNGSYSSFSALGGFGDSSGWSVLGTGDFNGDHASDVLLSSTVNGVTQLYDWQVVNGAVTGLQALGMGFAVNSGWTVLGTGDFNGDGTSDVLLMNSQSRQVGVWTVSNGAAASYTPLGIANSEWSFGGIGDFNGDGRSDIIWRTSAELNIWNSQAGLSVQTVVLGNNAPFDWNSNSQLSIGDFNGDGTSDLLWSGDSQHFWFMRTDDFFMSSRAPSLGGGTLLTNS